MKANEDGLGIGTKFDYVTALPGAGIANEAPLTPAYGKEPGVKTHIYATWEGASSFYLFIKYNAQTQLVTFQQTQEVGKTWITGTGKSDAPDSIGTYEQTRVEITKQGWNEIPIWVYRWGNDH